MNWHGRILFVGGYGFVGGWTIRHLRAAGHDVDVVIGGRRPAEAATPAREWGASVVKLDTGHAETGLAAAGPVDLVVSTVQDPDDKLLMAALQPDPRTSGSCARRTTSAAP